MKITNPDKVVFPNEKLKKIDVINYYIEISNLMLPFLENRLLSVIRCHDEINSKCFYKKHPTTDRDMVNIKKIKGADYFYINSEEQLIYQAQMGTIEFHPWGSNINKINNPNVMVFDLDPDKELPLSKLRASVLKVKSVLDELGLISFLKTSGGKGYHIVVPFSQTKGWKSFYDMSYKISTAIEQMWPKDFTTNIRKSERNGKIFVDYLRNNKGSTCVAPYSIRARGGACVSFPISWDDLKTIKPNEITVKNWKKYLNNSWDNFFEIDQKIN